MPDRPRRPRVGSEPTTTRAATPAPGEVQPGVAAVAPGVTELEAELEAAKRTIDVLIARVETATAASPTQAALFDAAARMSQLVEERTRELESARAEFRALMANLDGIVRQRTRALAESEAKLRDTNGELERQAEAKSDFIAVVAHELRTPLTSIVGYLELLSEGKFGAPPPQMKRPLDSTRRNALRLKRLVDDMLSVSRIDQGKMRLQPDTIDLGALVRDVVTEMLPLATAKQQEIAVRCSPIPPIEAETDKLHQIIVNLVSNAIRYTPTGGRIAVNVDEAPAQKYPGGWVRIRVRDSGIGIPVDQRQRIFEPFTTVSAAKHHSSEGPDSAGLGLYIARGLVELHGGVITVDSEPGEYAEFTVLLPIQATETQPRRSGSGSDPGGRAPSEPVGPS